MTNKATREHAQQNETQRPAELTVCQSLGLIQTNTIYSRVLSTPGVTVKMFT